MNKFTKWFLASILLAFIGLIVVFNVEEWASMAGERSMILFGTLCTFLLVIVSLFCLFKANVERMKRQMVILLITSILPITVFVMNGLIFTVYFIGK